MCTAVVYKNGDCYFGRNLDLEYSYDETITITPRNFVFDFKYVNGIKSHYAIIGTAFINNKYPLYYDAVNEKGLGIAGLNFPDNAVYNEYNSTGINIATYEFIPYILSLCGNINDVRLLLKNINLTNDAFCENLPPSPLHWIITDSEASITVEAVNDGLKVYENPYGVLTNNPTFDKQVFNLNNYMHITAHEPENHFTEGLKPYSRGMGALGLPGDLSSMSRFVRAVFTKENSVSKQEEEDNVNQFFHILTSVEMVRGCVKIENGEDITVYSACCNTDKGIYYYKTYTNHQITAVSMHNENLEGCELISYPMLSKSNILYQN